LQPHFRKQRGQLLFRGLEREITHIEFLHCPTPRALPRTEHQLLNHRTNSLREKARICTSGAKAQSRNKLYGGAEAPPSKTLGIFPQTVKQR
jgi:hypothetical protein